MPKKYNDINNLGLDPISNANKIPIIETLNGVETNDVIGDVMSSIIDNKQKMKNTSMVNMIGVLTPVTYYHIKPDDTANYGIDANAPNDISTNNNRYIKINNFKIFSNSQNGFDNDIDEQEKSYTSNGSMTILPRTIKPYENDMFIMKFYGKYIWYRVTSVKVKGPEQDSGFECDFTYYQRYEDFKLEDEYIAETVDYIHELTGTSYRPIMATTDYENLKKIQEIYNHISSVFNSLFYDKNINCYMLKKYNNDVKFYKENIININTLGKQNGLFKGNSYQDFNGQNPAPVRKEETYYDSLLNVFMAKHEIFRSFDGLLLAIEPILPQDRTAYRRSIFGCLETKSVSYYKNTIVSPIDIVISQPGLPPFFVGKKNMLHTESKIENNVNTIFPSKLVNQLITGNKLNMSTNINDMHYGSIDALIIETITRYVYGKTDDFIDRFVYLYKNIDQLYESTIEYSNIYYLFPILGFVIDKFVKQVYQDNIYLR